MPGKIIPTPENCTDPTAFEALSYTRNFIVFMDKIFARNSLDDAGFTVISSVHYSRSYPNAFWNGSQTAFGDGDGLIFKGMTNADDFVGHELAHGLTQYTAKLKYEGEAGALNESISDIFGSMARQWKRRWTAETADWVIGSDMMGTVAIQNNWLCLRSLKDPMAISSLSKQAMHYRDYNPDGWPHDNSGISNHAFFLAAQALGGYSWESYGRVWYGAMTGTEIHPLTTFKEFASITLDEARRLFPSARHVEQHLKGAWQAVGVI
ncbi:M4 family metallopeptidase [Kaistia granuli]|uniref:M4 family metallopeptidase n=1 Tax=Kaistia granuli TaxID=363259 RepID=UPI0018DD01DB|nr:M4 family metallopeptidase [Kaistia granuli]